ncbi:branched-chain amino acid aminotransferase II-3 [Coleophoma cylindrospora]|uniref:Branched-chain amino acid aminotransferase II-3 n=1 Tax=Coleophoma cylindrospora TaxID=1849047 RepID=A0A3D8QA99_9HELO|nr:branched-chain amino acid aminotransferase II-3 [Coleophoma cylindrospora]
MSFPPAPVDSIDWSSISSTQVNDDCGHVECHYSVLTETWSEPVFVQEPYLKVHGLSSALNYGQQVYEGLRGIRIADNKIILFRPEKHAERLIHSASYVSMPAPPIELFLKAVNMAVAKNAIYVPPADAPAQLYIRPLLFGSGGQLMLIPSSQYTFCVFVQPGTTSHDLNPIPTLIMEDFDRAAPEGTGSAKLGGNYAPAMKSMAIARAKGFPLTLHLDSKTRTVVEEFSSCAFLGVKKDGEQYTITATESKNTLKSITSDSCLEIAKTLGWKVEQRSVPYTELPEFSEILAVGTAASILPVRSITRESTSDCFSYVTDSGEPGPAFITLSKILREVQQGKTSDFPEWRKEVTEIP